MLESLFSRLGRVVSKTLCLRACSQGLGELFHNLMLISNEIQSFLRELSIYLISHVCVLAFLCCSCIV